MKQYRQAMVVMIALCSLHGCSRGVEQAEKKAVAGNAAETARVEAEIGKDKAFNRGWATPPGWKTECFGRSLFDVPGDIEWAVADWDAPKRFSVGLTPKLYNMKVGFVFDEVGVTMTPSGNRARQFEVTREELDSVDGSLKILRRELAEHERTLGEEIAERDTKGIRTEHREALQASIERLKQEIADTKERIERVPKANYVLDLSLPDSFAYRENRRLYVFLWRGDRMYRFYASSTENNPLTFEQVQAKVLGVVNRFRVRKTFEIPKEPGVCIPHGFIADGGTSGYKFKSTFRMLDTPNVTYAIGVGKNPPDSTPLVFMDAISSSAAAMGGGLQGEVTSKFVSRRYGPKRLRVGEILGIVGGFEVTGPDNAEPAYRVDGGFEGVQGSDLFPHVTFEMQSYRKGEDPGLTQVAPPFDESMGRLEKIMRSVRLRAADAPAVSVPR